MGKIINHYIKSQSGAALILVLFVVLFLSIVGTAILNATTYSMKSVVKNESEEAEFYRLEGALDLVLYNLNETREYNGGTEPLLDYQGKQVYAPKENNRPLQPLILNKKGIYFFIKDYLGKVLKDPDPDFNKVFDNIIIGGEEIQFHFDETEGENSYELTASYVRNPSMKRKIGLTVLIPPKPIENYNGGIVVRGDYIQSPIDLDDNTSIHHKLKPKFVGKYIGGINFEDKKRENGLSVNISTTDLTPTTDIVNSPSYYNQITGSNKTIITIPKDKVVYANLLNWTGNNRTLIVEGTLIIDSFDIQGSNTMEVKNTGTIIANHFGIWSNSPEITFPMNTGTGSESGGGTPQYTSNVDWVSNNYNIDNYETER